MRPGPPLAYRRTTWIPPVPRPRSTRRVKPTAGKDASGHRGTVTDGHAAANEAEEEAGAMSGDFGT